MYVLQKNRFECELVYLEFCEEEIRNAISGNQTTANKRKRKDTG